MAAHLGVVLCAVLILGMPLYHLSISNLLEDRMMGWASILTYYTVYPVVFFSNIAIFILSFLTAPLVEVSSHILYISFLPWHLSAKLEVRIEYYRWHFRSSAFHAWLGQFARFLFLVIFARISLCMLPCANAMLHIRSLYTSSSVLQQ